MSRNNLNMFKNLLKCRLESKKQVCKSFCVRLLKFRYK